MKLFFNGYRWSLVFNNSFIRERYISNKTATFLKFFLKTLDK